MKLKKKLPVKHGFHWSDLIRLVPTVCDAPRLLHAWADVLKHLLS